MKNVLSVLLWIPAFAVRAVFVLLGLIAVPLSLLGDGKDRTPKMWRFWTDAEERLPSWFEVSNTKLVLYTFGMLAAAWYAAGNWYPLVAIYFIFATAAALAAVVTGTERKFWWFAIRNPTRGFAAAFTQPIDEPRPNPDDLVYGKVQKSATRFLRHELFSEFWYLRAVGDKKFEFRIGWKFADGTPGFSPVIQFRYGR